MKNRDNVSELTKKVSELKSSVWILSLLTTLSATGFLLCLGFLVYLVTGKDI